MGIVGKWRTALLIDEPKEPRWPHQTRGHPVSSALTIFPAEISDGHPSMLREPCRTVPGRSWSAFFLRRVYPDRAAQPRCDATSLRFRAVRLRFRGRFSP